MRSNLNTYSHFMVLCWNFNADWKAKHISARLGVYTEECHWIDLSRLSHKENICVEQMNIHTAVSRADSWSNCLRSFNGRRGYMLRNHRHVSCHEDYGLHISLSLSARPWLWQWVWMKACLCREPCMCVCIWLFNRSERLFDSQMYLCVPSLWHLMH